MSTSSFGIIWQYFKTRRSEKPQTTHLFASRIWIPVSKASVPEIEEMAWSEYSKGLPSNKLNGVGVHDISCPYKFVRNGPVPMGKWRATTSEFCRRGKFSMYLHKFHNLLSTILVNSTIHVAKHVTLFGCRMGETWVSSRSTSVY